MKINMVDGKSNHLHFYVILFFYLKYNFEGQNVWTCADWAYGLQTQFESLNLRYWETGILSLGAHAINYATSPGFLPMLFDAWVTAPMLYGFQVFPPPPGNP